MAVKKFNVLGLSMVKPHHSKCAPHTYTMNTAVLNKLLRRYGSCKCHNCGKDILLGQTVVGRGANSTKRSHEECWRKAQI